MRKHSAGKRGTPDIRYSFRNCHMGQNGPRKSHIFNIFELVAEFNSSEPGAVQKCSAANIDDPIANGDVGKRKTVDERSSSNVCHTIGDFDLAQFVTTSERRTRDALDMAANLNCF